MTETGQQAPAVEAAATAEKSVTAKGKASRSTGASATTAAGAAVKPAKKLAKKPAGTSAGKPARKPSSPAQTTPVAKPGSAGSAKPKHKLVRDSFTMPKQDFALIESLKDRMVDRKRPTKKSELLRAGLHVLTALPDARLAAALDALVPLKAGRPKKDS